MVLNQEVVLNREAVLNQEVTLVLEVALAATPMMKINREFAYGKGKRLLIFFIRVIPTR